MHEAHVPEAHGTSAWVKNPPYAPLKNKGLFWALLDFAHLSKYQQKCQQNVFFECYCLYDSSIITAVTNQYSIDYLSGEKKEKL